MPKKKKKKSEGHHMDESWLLPYADLLTLLLAVFIVLFSMSSVDASKFNQLSKAFNDIFTGGTGPLDYPSPIPEGEKESSDEIPMDRNSTEKEKGKESEGEIEKTDCI